MGEAITHLDGERAMRLVDLAGHPGEVVAVGAVRLLQEARVEQISRLAGRQLLELMRT